VKKAWIAIAVAAVLAAGAAEYASVRKGLDRQRRAIDQQWANVESALRQSADLMPEFAEAVNAAVKGQSGTLQALVDARSALAAGRTPQEKIQAYGQLDGAFSRLLALTETNPRLRSDKHLPRIQDEIARAENDVAVERRKYNEALENYNAALQVFPNNIVAALARFSRSDAYFQPNPGRE